MKKHLALCIAMSSFAAAVHAKAEPDSAVQADEASAAASDTSAKLLALADEDADGNVNRDELAGIVHKYIAKRVAQRHAQLDRNRDGRVTRSEVPKMDAARFARLDLDRNGSFSVGELSRVMIVQTSERLTRVFARLDIDGNAVCSLAELDGHRQTLLAQAKAKDTQQATAQRTQQAKAPSATTTF
jgi:Ca2+-binding EF-hand superfamily protein